MIDYSSNAAKIIAASIIELVGGGFQQRQIIFVGVLVERRKTGIFMPRGSKMCSLKKRPAVFRTQPPPRGPEHRRRPRNSSAARAEIQRVFAPGGRQPPEEAHRGVQNRYDALDRDQAGVAKPVSQSRRAGYYN